MPEDHTLPLRGAALPVASIEHALGAEYPRNALRYSW
jgi:hypothetical protein